MDAQFDWSQEFEIVELEPRHATSPDGQLMFMRFGSGGGSGGNPGFGSGGAGIPINTLNPRHLVLSGSGGHQMLGSGGSGGHVHHVGSGGSGGGGGGSGT